MRGAWGAGPRRIGAYLNPPHFAAVESYPCFSHSATDSRIIRLISGSGT